MNQIINNHNRTQTLSNSELSIHQLPTETRNWETGHFLEENVSLDRAISTSMRSRVAGLFMGHTLQYSRQFARHGQIYDSLH